jgi:hypothetical protein
MDSSPHTGALPQSFFKLLGTADWFNLKGNTFSNVEAGTALHNMVYTMNNWREVETIEWQENNGGYKFTSVPTEIEFFHALKRLDLSNNNIAGGVDASSVCAEECGLVYDSET